MDTNNQENNILSKVRDFSVTYHTRIGPVSAVDGVSFDIKRGEILGLVGESGCGKSTLGKGLMRMIAPPGEVSGGKHIFNGEDVMEYNERQMRDFRGRCVSMIFQDPLTSLNPVQRIDQHIVEAIQVHEPKTKKSEALERATTLIEKLGIQKNRLNAFPHHLSGGMRQRVMIALGLVLNADLIIADEATTSLDVIVEAQLVDQIQQIREEFGVSILMITHNIALVAQIADRLAVMYAGRLVEIGSIYDVFENPQHPYTKGLLQSVPTIRLEEREELYKMPGEPPNLTHPPTGCRFHPRCPKAMPICSQKRPKMVEVGDRHQAQCWLFQEHENVAESAGEVTP
jgi:oligopeptide/dipeptide ABC transporter ATP-binding protein